MIFINELTISLPFLLFKRFLRTVSEVSRWYSKLRASSVKLIEESNTFSDSLLLTMVAKNSGTPAASKHLLLVLFSDTI
ncbi:hypothetical protein HID58_016103 [Brassica napus]|uniref:Uncharacterized protein n=1 Tax=Brassica napus TaxID=3708 RepID=A0ABQ8DM00_BRANA|nr:hypothetical protein HID58_016103 [Brassica napus]